VSLFRNILGLGSVARLRARADREDADFARRERRAAATLAAIRHRNAFEASARLLDFPETPSVPGLCTECLDSPYGRRT
jgi:hypothetical protein